MRGSGTSHYTTGTLYLFWKALSTRLQISLSPGFKILTATNTCSPHRHAFTAVLSHGLSLRRLRRIRERGRDHELKPYVLSRARIERLAHACLNLEVADLRIHRSYGDKEEVRTYGILSQLFRVDRFSLLLGDPRHGCLTRNVGEQS